MPEGCLRLSVLDGTNVEVLQENIERMLSRDLTAMLKDIDEAQRALADEQGDDEGGA